jgi:CheY-like chemotaxis protein
MTIDVVVGSDAKSLILAHPRYWHKKCLLFFPRRGNTMVKKLLLVDDEKFFLDRLKEDLLDCKDVFTTDICFSVNEAIELNKKNEYDLIVTDIRMPETSGLELFEYLQKHHFKGGVFAMTAYGSKEVFEKIKQLGGLDIIMKPFDSTWFKDRILDFFSGEEEGVSGKIHSIDLASILQMINMENKSVAVRIEVGNDEGFLYFSNGMMVHAEYKGLLGEDAALHLIKLNKGRFSLLKSEEDFPQTIFTPFPTLMINIMKVIDEEMKQNDEKDLKEGTKMDATTFNEAIDIMKEKSEGALISCSIWANADGQSIVTYDPYKSVNPEAATTLFNRLSGFIRESLKDADFPVELNRYYLLDLTDNKIALVLQLGDYQWGMLIDTAKTTLGFILNIALPEAMAIFI